MRRRLRERKTERSTQKYAKQYRNLFGKPLCDTHTITLPEDVTHELIEIEGIGLFKAPAEQREY